MSNCACTVNPAQLICSGRSVYFLEITAACNNACPGCGNVYAGDRSAPPLSAQRWRVVVDRLAPSAAEFRITGGEPTLHPQFEEIVGHINSSGLPFVLFTNGRWANPDRLLDFLAGMPNLAGLLVSLHGAGPAAHESFSGVAGSFAETVQNIRRATAAGLRVNTSTVLTRHNYAQIEDIVALGKRLGVERASFQRYIGATLPGLEAGRDELQMAVGAIEELVNRNGNGVRFGTPIPHCFVPNCSKGCLAGVAQATVDPWGNLRPCSHISLVCGNLLRQSLDEIWSSGQMQLFRKAIPEPCSTCADFEVCRGGCRAAIMEFGLSSDPLMAQPILS